MSSGNPGGPHYDAYRTVALYRAAMNHALAALRLGRVQEAREVLSNALHDALVQNVGFTPKENP